jgi:ribosome-associated protein
MIARTIAMRSPAIEARLGAPACRPHQEAGSSHGDFVKITTVEVQITGETIRLGQLLKLSGLADSGGEAKLLLADGVLVNGEAETRRGRQLRDGDVVEASGVTVRIVTA